MIKKLKQPGPGYYMVLLITGLACFPLFGFSESLDPEEKPILMPQSESLQLHEKKVGSATAGWMEIEFDLWEKPGHDSKVHRHEDSWASGALANFRMHLSGVPEEIIIHDLAGPDRFSVLDIALSLDPGNKRLLYESLIGGEVVDRSFIRDWESRPPGSDRVLRIDEKLMTPWNEGAPSWVVDDTESLMPKESSISRIPQ